MTDIALQSALVGVTRRDHVLRALAGLPAAQQPDWADHPDLACIRAELADLPGLVDHRDLRALTAELARAAAGHALVLQVGECAETFAMVEPRHVRRRVAMYRRLGRRLTERTGRPTIVLARMAGQHAKPRSDAVETLPDRRVVPVYRGDAVNAAEATRAARAPDPWRMLTSYDRSKQTLDLLTKSRTYVSHEALLRDYEDPLTRGADRPYASSGHLVWVGERTRHLDGWHVRWAASIANPVAVKIGPSAAVQDIAELVRVLNPARTPGRLTLICRLGADAAADRLHAALTGTAGLSHEALWVCDPMHGNTRRYDGVKTRLLPDMRAEVTTFVRSLLAHGRQPAGLHLEATPEDVHECASSSAAPWPQGPPPPCDPRLTEDQAETLIDVFAEELHRNCQKGDW